MICAALGSIAHRRGATWPIDAALVQLDLIAPQKKRRDRAEIAGSCADKPTPVDQLCAVLHAVATDCGGDTSAAVGATAARAQASGGGAGEGVTPRPRGKRRADCRDGGAKRRARGVSSDASDDDRPPPTLRALSHGGCDTSRALSRAAIAEDVRGVAASEVASTLVVELRRLLGRQPQAPLWWRCCCCFIRGTLRGVCTLLFVRR